MIGLKKQVDKGIRGWYSVLAVANPTAWFESQNIHKACKRLNHRALFLCSMIPLAVHGREPSGSLVSLWTSLSTDYVPPFLFESNERRVFQPQHKEIRYV